MAISLIFSYINDIHSDEDLESLGPGSLNGKDAKVKDLKMHELPVAAFHSATNDQKSYSCFFLHSNALIHLLCSVFCASIEEIVKSKNAAQCDQQVGDH